MEIELKRLGRIAMLAALTNESEEWAMKDIVKKENCNYKLAVTFISGLRHDIQANFIKSLVGCALQNNVIQKTGSKIHALVHAGLDAMSGVANQVPADGSLKLKVAIVADDTWIAVAVYGDSAYYPLTNHERACLGVMHL